MMSARARLGLPATRASERTHFHAAVQAPHDHGASGKGVRARRRRGEAKASTLLVAAAPTLFWLPVAFPWGSGGQSGEPGPQWAEDASEGGSVELHSIGLGQGLH